MADSTTPNLGLTKPEVGASSDSWGLKANTNYDIVDALFSVNGQLLVSKGGTGAGTAAGARANLGLGPSDTVSFGVINSQIETKVSGVFPRVLLEDTDAAANQKFVRWVTNATEIFLQTLNDLQSAGDAFYQAIRITGSHIVGAHRWFTNGLARMSIDVEGVVQVERAARMGSIQPPTGGLDIGFRGAPRGAQQNGPYSFALADSGCVTMHAAGGAADAYTLSADASVAWPQGTVLIVVVTSGGVVITPATGVTIAWAGTTLTGSRTLSAFGMATLTKVDGNTWVISGAGLS